MNDPGWVSWVFTENCVSCGRESAEQRSAVGHKCGQPFVCGPCIAKARSDDDDLDYFVSQVEMKINARELAKRKRTGMIRHHTPGERRDALVAQRTMRQVVRFIAGMHSWHELLGDRHDVRRDVREAMSGMDCYARFRWWRILRKKRKRQRA